jgi:Kef-type K+ transport system membrane component KefB
VSPALFDGLFPHRLDQAVLLDSLTQVCALLLVGVSGAQLDVLGIGRRLGAAAATVSLAGLVVPLGLGVGAGLVLRSGHPDRLVFALLIGVGMCVTSIPVIAKILSDVGILQHRIGRLILVAGFIDDVVAWLLLAVVGVLAGDVRDPRSILESVGGLMALILLAVLVGTRATRWLLQRTSRPDSYALDTAVVVLVVLAGAVITQWLGLEAMFGAFVAGSLVGSAGMDPARLTPLRTMTLAVFAPLFLATAGLRMDLSLLVDRHALVVAAALLGLAVVGKLVGAYAGARVAGIGHWEAGAVAVGMNARGVVAIVVAMVGLRLGILDATMYTIVVFIGICTSLMAAPLLMWTVLHIDDLKAGSLNGTARVGPPPRPQAGAP